MTELDLYKFAQGKEIDWRGDMLILWIEPSNLGEFTELCGYNMFDEGGMEVSLQMYGVIALDIVDVCEHHGIDPENILKKENGSK